MQQPPASEGEAGSGAGQPTNDDDSMKTSHFDPAEAFLLDADDDAKTAEAAEDEEEEGSTGVATSASADETAASESEHQKEAEPTAVKESSNVVAHAFTTVVLGGIYIVLSSALIDFNKYLMSPGNFPFGTTLVLIHSVTCVLCSAALYAVRPGLFPALTDPEKKVEINSHMLLFGAAPVAVTMCCSLVLSNMAYLWSNVAFLQMMKEANVALVYVMALATGLEQFSVMHSQVLVLLMGATLVSVDGEAEFSFIGCMVQAMAQLCECTKVTLQSILLSGGGRKKLDPLSYLLVVTPVCCLVLLKAVLLLALLQHMGWTGPHWAVPGWADFVRNWKLLVLNGLLAFGLNLVVAAFVRHTSSVAVILVGIVKDAVIVFFNVMFMNEHITRMQNVGFVLQLAFVGLWSTMKTFPVYFQGGWGGAAAQLVTGLETAYGGKSDPLLKKP
eukprot:TRINITY_DN7695_c0_g1_i1.p1 TRINITY_DN7695_c0_g1~~TRINITY_DN7695_c0_g1_i1.p1  ORF type:complete len:444 (-),score=121.99 TRINITY_DN7695_c0_g1_i1:36-1367(-)